MVSPMYILAFVFMISTLMLFLLWHCRAALLARMMPPEPDPDIELAGDISIPFPSRHSLAAPSYVIKALPVFEYPGSPASKYDSQGDMDSSAADQCALDQDSIQSKGGIGQRQADIGAEQPAHQHGTEQLTQQAQQRQSWIQQLIHQKQELQQTADRQCERQQQQQGDHPPSAVECLGAVAASRAMATEHLQRPHASISVLPHPAAAEPQLHSHMHAALASCKASQHSLDCSGPKHKGSGTGQSVTTATAAANEASAAAAANSTSAVDRNSDTSCEVDQASCSDPQGLCKTHFKQCCKALEQQQEQQNQGLPQQQQLEQLPVQRQPQQHSLRAAAEGSDGQEACVICFLEYVPGDKIKQLPCGHFYHAACVDQWLRCNGLCPLCKSPVWTPRTYSSRWCCSGDESTDSISSQGQGNVLEQTLSMPNVLEVPLNRNICGNNGGPCYAVRSNAATTAHAGIVAAAPVH